MQIGSSRYDLQLGCLFYDCAGSIYKISTRKGFSFFLNFDLSSQSDRSELPVSPETEPTKWSSMAVFADSVPDSSFLNSHLFLDVVGKLGEMIPGSGAGSFHRLSCSSDDGRGQIEACAAAPKQAQLPSRQTANRAK